MTIRDLKTGEVATITEIKGSDAFTLRLIDMGFIPNTKIKIQKIAPFGDPIQIEIRGYEIALRKENMKNFFVKKEDKPK